jgi:hypothetical protein
MMDYYDVVMDGCSHRDIYSVKELNESAERRYNPKTGRVEDWIICKGCAEGRAGYCKNSIYHNVLLARKLWPHEVRSLLSVTK